MWLPVLAIGVVLLAGCAGLERAPQGMPPTAAPAEAVAPIEPRIVPVASTSGPSPGPKAEGVAVPSATVVQPAGPARRESPAVARAKTVESPPPPPARVAPPPPARSPVSTRTPALPVVKPAVQPPLDLKSLETRLKATKAIGVFTKLTLKNQIDDLLDRFRAFHRGVIKTSLAELRRSFDMLVMKTLALLQDADPPLAGALASSRESIWGILSDPAKFATV